MPDGTEVGGYSALNAEYSELSGELTDKAVRAGLPEDLRFAPQRTGSAPDRASEATIQGLKQETDSLLEGLTPDEKLAAQNLSKALSRRQPVQESPDLLSALDKLEVKNPTQHGALYRGEEMSPTELSDILDTGEFSRPWRVPTSYNRDLSELHSRPMRPDPAKVPVLFRIREAERGTSLISDDLSMELENVLLPPGAKFRVLGHKVSEDGTNIIDVASSGSSLGKGRKVALAVGDEQKLRGRIAGVGRKRGMTEEDAALKDFARQAGKGEELDALGGISAVDRISSGTEQGLGVGWTPGGFYPRLGGIGERLKYRAYPGASELSALPKSAQPDAPTTSDMLRGTLAQIRAQPQLRDAARMGILPKPSDYNTFGLDYGMRGGAQAAGAGVAGGMAQDNDTMSAPLPDDVLQIILNRETVRP
jgi:hypothetical protein